MLEAVAIVIPNRKSLDTMCSLMPVANMNGQKSMKLDSGLLSLKFNYISWSENGSLLQQPLSLFACLISVSGCMFLVIRLPVLIRTQG